MLTHSHARALPPNTLQAAQPCPFSVQEPLPTQRLFWVVATLEGHAAGDPHRPLQTTLGASQTHIVGFDGLLAEKPFMQVKPQGFPSMHPGMLLSG